MKSKQKMSDFHSLKRRAYRQGLRAEKGAALLFRLKGYRILQHRFKTPVGEIDLIAQKGDRLVMVEVKARPSLSQGLFAITPCQQRRCLRAAEFFLACFSRYQGSNIRFDVVIQRPWRWPLHLRHVIFQNK